MYFATVIFNLILLSSAVLALPMSKRIYKPSSGVFSVIAHHEGAVFQYHLLKYDGLDLVLNADELAFFGRVRASEGYILNLPGSDKTENSTQEVAYTTNVYVNPNTYKLSTTNSSSNSTHGFGIDSQKLSYKNSTAFLACPDQTYRGEYHVYWANNNKTVCPYKARGYDIELIVQMDTSIDYNPTTNKETNSSHPDITYKKRFHFF